MGGNLFLPGENVEILLRFTVDIALPTLDRTLVEGEGLVGDRETVIDVDDAPEAAALGASTEWGVEGK